MSIVDKIIQALAYKLLQIYPDKNVYDEYVAQNLKKGGFFIEITEQDYTRLLNDISQSKVFLNLSYIPKSGKENIRSEINLIREVLLRELDDIGEFRITSKNANVVDDVLHIGMTIKYREINLINSPIMQKMSQNTKTKEV